MMTNKTELKKSINKAFKESNFDVTFKQLLTLSHYEISGLLSKKRWLDYSKHPKSHDYFYNSFCEDQHNLVFGKSHSETFLNWYLKNFSENSDRLNKLLVKHYPSEFIKGIKRNRLFLKIDFLNQIKKYDWEAKHSIDILAWIELQKVFDKQQSKIDKFWSKISPLSIEALLSGIICWIDEKFYADTSPLNIEKLQGVYNYSLTYTFSKKAIDPEITEEKFDDVFFNTKQSSNNKAIGSFLESINEWLDFKTTILTSYCFDDNFQATMENGDLSFNLKSDEEYEKWQKDGERYLVNSNRYLFLAHEIYNHKKENGLEIEKGRFKIDKDINTENSIKNEQINLFLSDLCVESLKLYKEETHISKINSSLIYYSANRYSRYVEPMKRFTKDFFWVDALVNTIEIAKRNGITNTPLPYMFIHKDELIEIYEDAIPELNKIDIETLINYFSYTLNYSNSVDPFNILYSVSETPFIKIGDHLFTSNSFFAVNNWFYTIAQRVLSIYAQKSHISNQQKTSVEMEKFLAEKFENRGWNSKVIDSNQTNQMDGDIDLFVDDGKTQLLIQLKRTKLKLDLATNYKDGLETDLKASGQLNEGVKSLKAKPILGLDLMENHRLWIVTTSFEGILNTIDNCLKVNYFDLLWALDKKFNSLHQLKEYIELDKPFLDCKNLF